MVKKYTTIKIKRETWAKLSSIYTQLYSAGKYIPRSKIIELLVDKYGEELKKQLLKSD